MEKKKPEKTFSAGPVSAAVWKNQTGEGETFYSVMLTRTYKDADGNFQDVPSFGEDYLDDARYCLERAQRFIESLAE